MAKKKNLLVFSVLIHLLSCFCSFYLDSYKWPNGYKEINYWCNFFSWWSVQASLLTIVYFIYWLFKKSPSSYFDKILDLIVINANIISIGVFTAGASPILWGGKPWLPVPSKDGIINILSFKINRKVFWWSYSIIWHYLAPLLTISYFTRRKVILAKTYYERRELFLYSFFHPLLYLVFVLSRPLIPGSENYPCGKSKYPYFFLDWIGGNKYSGLIWCLVAISVIFFFLFVFWLSVLLFWRYAKNSDFQNTNKPKNKKIVKN